MGMRILIADDDAICRRLLASKLAEWGYEVAAVSSGEEAWQVLQAEGAPTFAILDWMMPGLSGPEVCSRVRARGVQRYTYLLLLTGRDSKEDLIAGLEAGADDYITKPFDTCELRARLRTARRILELQEQLLKTQQELEIQATHDPLTQVWNRRGILEHLAREASRAAREGKSLAVILVDLDHFKTVNDTRGHVTGDHVLQEVARRLNTTLRVYDALGRYGGEEFLAVLTEEKTGAAEIVAERLRLAVAGTPIPVGRGEVRVTVSLGLASGTGAALRDPQALVQAADIALYRAKHEGRNRVSTALLSPDPRPVPSAAS
jgi:diguanylate cyclase (GGDEF)-like protein